MATIGIALSMWAAALRSELQYRANFIIMVVMGVVFQCTGFAFIWVVPWVSRPAAEMLALPLSQIAMILLACLAVRRGRSGHRHAAVDVESLPGDVAGLAAR